MNRFGFIGRGQRLTCAGCETRLDVEASQANLFWAVLLVVTVLLLILAGWLADEVTKSAILLVLALFALFLHYRLTPRLVRLEVPASD